MELNIPIHEGKMDIGDLRKMLRLLL